MGTDSGCAWCAALEREVSDLRREAAAREARHAEIVRELREELRDLRARLHLDSRNSSKPPSSDPPGVPPSSRPPSGRKAGGQPGHEGKTRERFAPEEVDRRVEVPVTRCHFCDAALPRAGRETLLPARHQVVDLPVASAVVTEYVLERAVCAGCGVVTGAPLPEGVPASVVGPRLHAALVLLVGRYRLSRREAQALAVDLFGPKARIALGTLGALEARAVEALELAYREAARVVRTGAVVHADETSFRRGRRKTWLWTAATERASFFRIDAFRSKEAFGRLLPDFQGVLTTDRWASYHDHPPNERQLCWAHLKRNFQELVDRKGAAAPIGHAGLRACANVFDAFEDHRAGRLEHASLARRLAPTRRALFASLHRFRDSPDRAARALCRDLLRHFPSVFTFTRRRGVPPTNNLAERELRPAVLWRKGSFGCQSERGERFVDRMLTVVRTLRRQGRNLLDFLEASIRASLRGSRPPRLLTA
ncbi:MAG: IS66 family transposase [Candidatus Binatia bacterium]